MRLDSVYKNAFGYAGFIALLFAVGFVCGVFILYICRYVSKVIKGAATDKPSEEMQEYINDLVNYLALSFLLMCGPALFKLIIASSHTDPHIGISLYFVALYVIAGGVISLLYTHWPVLDKEGHLEFKEKVLVILNLFAVPVVFCLGFYIYVSIFPESLLLLVLLYAAGGAVFYAASHVMTARFGFIQRQKTLDNVGKIAIMIAVLLVFATGFWQMGFPLTAEEFVVLATGHSFWIITDFKELKNNFSMFLEKTFLVITVIILAGRTLFYLLFPDAPEIYVLAACAGIGLGIARSIYTN